MGDYINVSEIQKDNQEQNNAINHQYDEMDTQNMSDYRRATYPVPKDLKFSVAPFFLLRRKIVQPTQRMNTRRFSSQPGGQIFSNVVQPTSRSTQQSSVTEFNDLTYPVEGILNDPESYVNPQSHAGTLYTGRVYGDYVEVDYGY